MNLKVIEPCSLYAIEAVYTKLWSLIPDKYKLPEKIYHQTNINPFYDAELNWSERMHYRLSTVPYPERKQPWFILTWNSDKGLLPSSLTRRRFETDTYTDKDGNERYCWFTNVEMNINFCLTSNDMPSLFEFQEDFWLNIQPKQTCESTFEHSVYGKFPVSFDMIDCSMNKYERDKNTLCALFMMIRTDFNIIGREVGDSEDEPLTRVEKVELNTYGDIDMNESTHLTQDIIPDNIND